MRRFGQLIKLKPEMKEAYFALHREPWPCVIKQIEVCNIRNYSIFLAPDNQLFSYFEYIGDNFEADMKKMAADECTQRWWKETDPCQESIDPTADIWWQNLQEIFHTT